MTLVPIKEEEVGTLETLVNKGVETQRDKAESVGRRKGGGRAKGTQPQGKSRQKILKKIQNAQEQPKPSKAACADPLGQKLPLEFGFQDSSGPAARSRAV